MSTEIANHLWQSTIVAGVAWLMVRAFRRNQARVRYWIWFSASLKFLLPFTLLIGLGGQLQWFSSAPPLEAPAVGSSVLQVSQAIEIWASPADSGGPVAPPTWLVAMLTGVWLCGAAAIAVVRIRLWLQVRVMVRSSIPAALGEVQVPPGVDVRVAPGVMEPGVVGWWRPTVLMPARFEAHLPASQLKAVLAHEFHHVRRRDNLTAAIHMAVETLFWFHPLVWWIGARLLDERERACDEAVLSELGEPQAYAEGILNVARHYVETPLVCVSGVGVSSIRARIEAILAHRVGAPLTAARRMLITLAALGAVGAPLAVGAVSRQLPEDFEVASIRSVESPRNYVRLQIVGDVFVGEGVTAAILIRYAYGLKDFQLSGGPDWIWDRDSQFDVHAKFMGEPHVDRVRPMLQRMLADRFQLRVRTEQRAAAILELIVAKGGATLTPTKGDNPTRRGCNPYPAICTDISMDDFADYLSSVVLSQVVVNQTGLAGRYDLKVAWAADSSQFRGNGGRGFFSGDGASLFAALTEQAGLQLRGARGDVPMAVVERVSRPSEN